MHTELLAIQDMMAAASTQPAFRVVDIPAAAAADMRAAVVTAREQHLGPLQQRAWSLYHEPRVPHISPSFGEMWESTALGRRF